MQHGKQKGTKPQRNPHLISFSWLAWAFEQLRLNKKDANTYVPIIKCNRSKSDPEPKKKSFEFYQLHSGGVSLLFTELTCIYIFSHDVALVLINFRVTVADVKTDKPGKALPETIHKMAPYHNLHYHRPQTWYKFKIFLIFFQWWKFRRDDNFMNYTSNK